MSIIDSKQLDYSCPSADTQQRIISVKNGYTVYLLEAVMNPRSWSFCSGFVHGQNYDNIDKRICPKGRKGRKPESSSKHPFKGPALQYLYFGSTNNFSRRLKQHRKGQNSQLVSKLETLSGCTKFCLFPVAIASGPWLRNVPTARQRS